MFIEVNGTRKRVKKAITASKIIFMFTTLQ